MSLQKKFEAFHEAIKLGRYEENQILREKRDIITHGSVIFRSNLEIQHRDGHTSLGTSPIVIKCAFAIPIAA